MKKRIINTLIISLTLPLILLGFFVLNVSAEEGEATTNAPATSISLMPVSKILQISSNSTYDEKLTVTNDGEAEIRVEAYAAPYSFVYSEDEDLYKLGYTNENNFTQLSRWITIKDALGNYVDRPIFSIPPHQSLDIEYRITTPNNIPSGGQYAVIFAHTLTNAATTSSGIRTEASPGMIVYGHSTEGEAIRAAEISDMKIEQNVTENNITRNNFYATAKVKNTGNIDFWATGKLTVQSIIGGGNYNIKETIEKKNEDGTTEMVEVEPGTTASNSVIPESEIIIASEWEETPSFGIYKVTWTVEAAGETETIERTIFLIPPFVIIISIIFLTIIIIWIIMGVRRRKERRSRLAV